MSHSYTRSVSAPGDLRIDKVLSSQPELGPSAPDGGYGWVILIAAVLLQLIIPSIVVAYGIFILFYRLEMTSGASNHLFLWDNRLIPAPLTLIITWTLSDPLTKKLVRTSTWPRLVATSGICLTCAGILVTWLAVKHNTPMYGFLIAGVLSGTGVSMITNQAESIIRMYFRMKLGAIVPLLQAVKTVGYILTPVILGELLLQQGILKVLILYQTVLLQGLIIVLVFKKPAYLKAKRRSYKLIEGSAAADGGGATEYFDDDEEEDVFAARSTTEMQQTVHSMHKYTGTSASGNNDGPQPSARHGCSATRSQQQQGSADGGFPDAPTAEEHHRYTPVMFTTVQADAGGRYGASSPLPDPDPGQAEPWRARDQPPTAGLSSVSASVQRKTLHDSFAEDFQADLDRIENFNDIPRPLFTDGSIHNDNNTYSYDNWDYGGVSRRSSQTVFAAVPAQSVTCCSMSQTWETIKYPSFYKSLLLNVTLQTSTFMFWCLFPSYLYAEYDKLHVGQTTVLIGCVAAGSLLFSLSTVCVTIQGKTKAILMSMFSFMGASGYAVLAHMDTGIWLTFGGLHVVLSITALQSLSTTEKMGRSKSKAQKNRETMLSLATGSVMLLIFAIDMSYLNCFRIMSLLHFINGALWFSNFVFKKIKKHMMSHPYQVTTIPAHDAMRE